MAKIDYIYEKKSKIRFSRNLLQLVAMVTMLIDHIGVMLIMNGKLYGYQEKLYRYVITLDEAKLYAILYTICRTIGRISFPIFAFLFVEGFLRSQNLFKYFIRLLLLAIVSEIPFDLMVFNKWYDFSTQNVIWTYIVNFIILIFIKKIYDMYPIFQLILTIIGGGICYIIKSDYAIEGTILIFIYYSFKLDRNLRTLFTGITTFIYTISKRYGAGAISAFFIHFYDGTKGPLELKKVHYIFYPLHMFILYLIVYFSYYKI